MSTHVWQVIAQTIAFALGIVLASIVANNKIMTLTEQRDRARRGHEKLGYTLAAIDRIMCGNRELQPTMPTYSQVVEAYDHYVSDQESVAFEWENLRFASYTYRDATVELVAHREVVEYNGKPEARDTITMRRHHRGDIVTIRGFGAGVYVPSEMSGLYDAFIEEGNLLGEYVRLA